MEDVTFNVDNCNRDVQEYIDSREETTPLITDLLGHGLNVVKVKMLKVRLTSNEMRTNMWNMDKKTYSI